MRFLPPALGTLAAIAVLALHPAGARAATPKAEVAGVADRDLRTKIEQAVGEAPNAPDNALEARRRAEDAADAAALALRSEGYYDYAITPDVSGEAKPKAVLKIDSGRRTVLAAPTVDWTAAPPDAQTQAAAIKALGLAPGHPARAADVIAAEGRLVATLQARGYADAKADTRKVVVDHADFTMTPAYRIDPGGLVKLDGVRLNSKGRTRLAWVTRLVPWRHGQVYSPSQIAELQRRLLDTGVYDEVSVALTPIGQNDKTDGKGARPVVVTLVDRAPISLEAGASYSTSEGLGGDATVRFFDLLGRADTVSLIARAAQLEKLLGVQLSLPEVGAPDQTLILEPDLYYDQTNAYDASGARLRLDLKRRLGKTSFLVFGVGVDGLRDDEYALGPPAEPTIMIARSLTLVTAHASLTLDRSDSVLNPTRGWKVNLDVQPTVVTGESNLAFVRTLGQASGYLPLDHKANTVLAARVRLGSILAASVPDVPAPLRFFSGGGGSVRGYTYQGIGPRFPNGAPDGGAGLFETSLELRRNLVGPWGVAAFLEGGSISRDPAPDFTHTEWAAGVGVRYRLGFAPLRADIAFPFDHTGGIPSLQVYLGIGQAF